MKERLFKTDNSWTPFIGRVLLAIVIFPHGAQKLFGWFGGYGFTGTMGYFTDSVGLPWIIGFIVIMMESLGAIALLLGVATRLMAIGYTILAMGIVFTSHIQYGFFMNWFGNQGGEGFEYFLLWIGLTVSLIFSGGGRVSLDRYLSVR